MRQLGTFSSSAHAERFAAFLLTQGITAVLEQEPDGIHVWVREEDHLAEAKTALEQFRQEPEHARYRDVLREAASRRKAEAERRERARRNVVAVGEQWQGPGGSGRRHPLVATVIGLCAVVFLLSGMGTKPQSTALRTLRFCDSFQVEGWDATVIQDRLIDIRRGQVWRLFTPIFVHYGVLHFVFDMVMFYSFASRIEERRGAWRLALLILATALVSNLVQGLAPAEGGAFSGGPFFGGMSGVVYGLLGYLWMKTVYDPGSGLYVASGTVLFLLIFMALGFTGVWDKAIAATSPGGVGGMANLAHLGGLLAGMAIGFGTATRRP